MGNKHFLETNEHHLAQLSSDVLAAILEYIELHLDAELSLPRLADIVLISPFYFARLFKQSTGSSVHQYVIERRIVRSRQLLEAGELTIAEVATAVGFSDQSHLTRHFRRRFGITPGQVNSGFTFLEKSAISYKTIGSSVW